MLNRALQLIQQGDYAGAGEILRRILTAEPENPDALHMLGVVLLYSGDENSAAELLGRAARLRPNRVDFHFNHGRALAALGRTSEATDAFKSAAALPFDGAEQLTHLARELHNAGHYADALECSRRAVAAAPNDGQALKVHGQNLMATGRFQPAIAALRQSVAIRPDDAEAHCDLAILLLMDGQLLEGYREFQWRQRAAGRSLLRDVSQAQWNGEDLAGKTLLVFADGGYGDTIQYVRYVPLLRGRAARIILECPGSLIPLFRSMQGVDEIIERGNPLPRFDAQVPLPSLPGIFKTDLSTIPHAVPYLNVPGERLKKWAQRLGTEARLKIGLCWSGNRIDPTDKRSMDLEMLTPLTRVAGARFYSLQLGQEAKKPLPPAWEMADHTREIRDFADTAALAEQLDLVITVDTSVAHLAGALGRPVWLLAPFVAAYQWMIGRSDSPWYPTMRIFRQPAPDDWAAPVASLAAELSDWARSHSDRG